MGIMLRSAFLLVLDQERPGAAEAPPLDVEPAAIPLVRGRRIATVLLRKPRRHDVLEEADVGRISARRRDSAVKLAVSFRAAGVSGLERSSLRRPIFFRRAGVRLIRMDEEVTALSEAVDRRDDLASCAGAPILSTATMPGCRRRREELGVVL